VRRRRKEIALIIVHKKKIKTHRSKTHTLNDMAHFSEYQMRRFRLIFNQYAEDAITEAEVEMEDLSRNASVEDPFQDPSIVNGFKKADIDASISPSIWKIKLSFRITTNELFFLMVI
jgi:hypothetical protein